MISCLIFNCLSATDLIANLYILTLLFIFHYSSIIKTMYDDFGITKTEHPKSFC